MVWVSFLGKWLGLGILGLLLLTGCGASPIPASGQSTSGMGRTIAATFPDGGYTFSTREQGARFLLMYDGTGKQDCQSSTTTTSTLSTERCTILFDDGTTVEWEFRTGDGKQGQLIINQTMYTIPIDGNVIVVKPQNTTLDVQLYQRDLSSLEADVAKIDAWIEHDATFAPMVNITDLER